VKQFLKDLREDTNTEEYLDYFSGFATKERQREKKKAQHERLEKHRAHREAKKKFS